jgi:hypothetical protein
MNLKVIWSFIAGDSKFAPLGVVLAILLAVVLERSVPSAGPWIGVLFVAVIGAGLVAGVFERTA